MLLRFLLGMFTFVLCGTAAAQEPGRRVALVVGIGSYPRLPVELGRDSARADAARVAAALEASGYQHVRLLTDGAATHANLQAVLRDQASVEAGPNDLFLLYFVGHGLGADFGDPRLLLYDTDPDALEGTSFGVKELAGKLTGWVKAGRFVVVTDAAFDGQLNGLAMLGPTGNDWPALGASSFVVSSAAPRQTAVPGAFARAFIDGLGGRADTNADGTVTASEMNGWLVLAVPEATGGKQFPTVQGTYDPAIPIATVRQAVEVTPAAPLQVVQIESIGPRIDKAKFVLRGGTDGRVECQDAAPVACDPTCYVWDFASGPCRVTLTVDGGSATGHVSVRQRGAYACTAVGETLQCGGAP